MAAEVEAVDGDTRAGQRRDDVGVAPGVLTEAMDDGDRGARPAGRRPTSRDQLDAADAAEAARRLGRARSDRWAGRRRRDRASVGAWVIGRRVATTIGRCRSPRRLSLIPHPTSTKTASSSDVLKVLMDERPTPNGATGSPDAEDLVGRLAHDLDAAFEALVLAEQDLVYGIALRSTRDAAAAEDIAQDVFVRAYRALADYDAERIRSLQLRAWLARITMNLCRNRARARRSRPIEVAVGRLVAGRRTAVRSRTSSREPCRPGPRERSRVGPPTGRPARPLSHRGRAAPRARPVLRGGRRRARPASQHRQDPRPSRRRAPAHGRAPGGPPMTQPTDHPPANAARPRSAPELSALRPTRTDRPGADRPGPRRPGRRVLHGRRGHRTHLRGLQRSRRVGHRAGRPT